MKYSKKKTGQNGKEEVLYYKDYMASKEKTNFSNNDEKGNNNLNNN